MADVESAKPDPAAISVFQQLHKYKGVTFSAIQPPKIFDFLQDWETRPDDVYIVTFPKSGTHWIWEIALLIMNDVHVEDIDRSQLVFALDIALSQSVEEVQTVITGPEVMSKWPSPRIMVTHLLEEFTPDQIKKSSKVIYFARNPKDVAVCWFKFAGGVLPAELGEWKGFIPWLLSEEMMNGGWFRHVKGWFAHRDDSNVLLCKYEDFTKDLRGSIKRVAEFLGRSLSEDKLDKLIELTEMEGMRKTYQQIEEKMGEKGKEATRLFGQIPYLRRGKVGGWKDDFTVTESEYFDKIYKETMEGCGIEFEFELYK